MAQRDGQHQARLGELGGEVTVRGAERLSGLDGQVAFDGLDPERPAAPERRDGARGPQPAHQRERERAERVGEGGRGVGGVVDGAERGERVHAPKLEPPGRRQPGSLHLGVEAGAVSEARRATGTRRYWLWGPSFSRWITSASLIRPPSTLSRTHVLTWWNPCRPAAPGLR